MDRCKILVVLASLGAIAIGCNKGDEATAGGEAATTATGESAARDKAPTPAPKDTDALPEETEKLALDEGGNKIPATMEVPRGSTIFADTPTALRINYGDKRERGKLFGVQVKEGNEFNTDLKAFAKQLGENKYGAENEILEQTDRLLRYKVTRKEDGYTSMSFTLLVDLGGKTWVCTQGNRGGYDEDKIARQIAACKTLAAK